MTASSDATFIGVDGSDRLRDVTLPAGLLLITLVLWIASMWTAELNIGPYGLIHSLPLTYFAAITLLSFSFFVTLAFNANARALLFVHLLALVIFLDFTPLILEGTPRFTYSYLSYGYADYIVQHGQIDTRITYFNWPGLHLVNAIFVQVTNVAPIELLMWAPIALRAVTLLVFQMLFRRLCTTSREFWIALWLSVVFALGTNYLLANSIGIILAVVIWRLALADVQEENTRSRSGVSRRIMIVILLAALTITHFLGSAILLLNLAILYVVARTVLRGRPGTNLIALSAVLIAAWLFYVAANFTAVQLPLVVQEILDLDRLLSDTVRAGGGGSSEHARVVAVRLAYVFGLSALAFLAFLRAALAWRRTGLSLAWLAPGVWVIGALSMALVTSYSGEIMARAFGATFFALAMLAALHMRTNLAPLVGIVALVAALFYPIYAYGNEAVDYVPQQEIAAVDFFHEHKPERFSVNADLVRIWPYRYFEQFGSGPPRYKMYGESYETAARFLFGDQADIYLSENVGDTGKLSQIYDNGNMKLSIEQ